MQNDEDVNDKDQEDVTCNMIHLCESDGELGINESHHDVTNQRDVYHTYHQQVFSDSEDPDENVICNTLAMTDHINLRKPSKE